jgi:hypothetical protein
MRYDSIDIFAFTVMGILCLFVIVGFADLILSNKLIQDVQIVEKSFSQSTQQTGVGLGYSTKGPVPVVTTSGHPDEWFVIVKTDKGKFIKVDVDVNTYYHLNQFDEVKMTSTIGGIIGITYANKIKSN